MEIREISLLTYILKCRNFSTPISDYYVRNAISINGMSLLAAYVDGEGSDILILQLLGVLRMIKIWLYGMSL